MMAPVFPGCQMILPGGRACTEHVKMRPICLIISADSAPLEVRSLFFLSVQDESRLR